MSMSIEKGTVESIDEGSAWVLTRRKDACGHCGHRGHCNTVEGMDRMRVQARNAARAGVGDEVELFLSTKTKFKGLFILYMFPVIGMVIGAFSAGSLSKLLGLSQDVGTVLFTLSGLGLALILARFVSGRMAATGELMPTISRIVGRAKKGAPPIPVHLPDSECCSPQTGSPS
jgi:sigma-E factor negative regulatory protein RseC